MSNWREQFEGESPFRATATAFAGYYHYVVLVALAAFAFWNRTRNWGNYVVNGEILLRGNDPWYHYRALQYVIENYPATMPFDAWTGFPEGAAPGQFSTIYDQFVATIALVVGLGGPSEELVKMVALFAPALVAVLIVVPTYVIGRRIGGRFAGVVAVAVFAFATDRLLSLSVAGFFDHHVAEALTQALAVLGVMVALRAAETDKPVYELVEERAFGVLRRSLGWAVVAGAAISVYLWVWPPGVLLVGILGVFFLVHLNLEYLRGRSPEHAAFVGVVALGVTGFLQLSSVQVLDIDVTSKSLLQPGLALAVAGGCAFMAFLARQWDERDISPYGYPAAVVGILVAGAGFMAVALPDLFGFFINQVLRVVGFQTSPTAGTVGEAQPGSLGQIYDFYSLASITAIGGGAVLLARQYLAEDVHGEHLLVVVWAAFLVAATLTQARFGYYLTVPVAALNAALVGGVMQFVGESDDPLDVEVYQVLAVIAVLLVVLAPMLGIASGGIRPVQAGGGAQNPGGIAGWQDSLSWLQEETPLEGQYGNASRDPMEYYGTFERTDDHDYGPGTYGVMSWWDYGHWITAAGERIPNANPFQQGATAAAQFLLTQNESRSLAFLDELDEDDAHTRYVMVDWKMVATDSFPPVNGKFFAPPTFDPDSNRSTYYSRIVDRDTLEETNSFTRSTATMVHKQPYYDSTVARLYLYHGSARNPQPVVTDWQGQERALTPSETFVQSPQQGSSVRLFGNMSSAREYVADDGTAQVGGIGPHPPRRVPALRHYRLVHMSELTGFQGRLRSDFRRTLQLSGLAQELGRELGNANQSAVRQRAFRFLYPNTPAWTKTFERVPGGTIEGTGPPDTTLRVSVPLKPENGRQFLYRQRVETDANGEFSTTVPYATTGYEEFGPSNGYTNTSVRAVGPYSVVELSDGSPNVRTNESDYLKLRRGEANVTEGQVLGVEDSPATVTLTDSVVSEPLETDDTRNGTAGDTPTNGTEGSDTQNGTTGDGTATGNGTGEGSLGPVRAVAGGFEGFLS